MREVYLALRGRSDGVLVEGPSGLLAPIGWNRTTADLASVLGLPLVIVCRPGRGTINHAALTLEAARRRNLAVQGLIVNGASDRPGLEELANRAELARLAPILEIVPDETISSLLRRLTNGPARPALPAAVDQLQAQARRHAGGQAEAEAVEARGARAPRHDDPRAGEHAHRRRLGQAHDEEGAAPAQRAGAPTAPAAGCRSSLKDARSTCSPTAVRARSTKV